MGVFTALILVIIAVLPLFHSKNTFVLNEKNLSIKKSILLSENFHISAIAILSFLVLKVIISNNIFLSDEDLARFYDNFGYLLHNTYDLLYSNINKASKNYYNFRNSSSDHPKEDIYHYIISSVSAIIYCSGMAMRNSHNILAFIFGLNRNLFEKIAFFTFFWPVVYIIFFVYLSFLFDKSSFVSESDLFFENFIMPPLGLALSLLLVGYIEYVFFCIINIKRSTLKRSDKYKI